MSGYTAGVAIEQGLTALNAEILKKPFRRSDLAQKVRFVLDNRRP